MRYVSTRGEAPVLAFSDALLAGLARDGGLYLPEAYPALRPDEIARLAGKPYADIAHRIIAPFTDAAFAPAPMSSSSIRRAASPRCSAGR